jgi:uncharacterized membrane protein (DUF4010 family)
VLLLLGLSFFLGLAIEDFYGRRGVDHPGGIRTFPLLCLCGAGLYVVEPAHALAFTAGLLVLGAWLTAYYHARVEQAAEKDEADAHRPGLGIMVPVTNLVAYLLGPIVLLTPSWFSIGVTVAAVLLLGARDALHDLARRIPLAEVTTLGKFLVLTGIVLPLLPNQPVVPWTSITPHQVWLAVVAVATLSYASYLLQILTPAGQGVLWASALGGLYSSTATTVVLARRAREVGPEGGTVQAGIVLATALMYLRVGVVIAVFDGRLARAAAPALGGLALFAALLAGGIFWLRRGAGRRTEDAIAPPSNPLELSAAAVFALLFVAVSLATVWVRSHYGHAGFYGLAAVVGVADIDPFVLSLAQGGLPDATRQALVVAVLIAASSNDLLKAVYAGVFAGWRRAVPAMLALVVVAAAGLSVAAWMSSSPR